MKAELKKNSLNQIIKDTEIFTEGNPVTDIGLIVKGRVRIHSDGVNVVVGTGNFLGLCDLEGKVHNVTYIADTDLALYTFPASGLVSTVSALIKSKKDYAPLIVTTLSKYIRELSKTYDALREGSFHIFKTLQKTYKTYQDLGKELGTKVIRLSAIENMEENDEIEHPSEELVEYYKVCAGFPNNLQKAYFGASSVITMRHIKEEVFLVFELIMGCKYYAEQLQDMAGPLILDDRSLYTNVLQQAGTLQRAGENISRVSDLFDTVIDRINFLENLMLNHAGIQLDIDHDFMEDAYFNLLNGKASQGAGASADASGEESEVDLSELDGALEIILDYGGMSGEEVESFKTLIDSFIDMKDKFATDDEARTLRRSIIKVYYDLYRKVFLRDYESDEPTPLIIDLFLRYGFLSERLVDDAIMRDLLSLGRSVSVIGECAVYDMKDWLTMIMQGKKEPSKSEFDLDYDENLREMRKTGQITQEEQKRLESDRMEKFNYELNNMFKSNHRLVFTQMTAFVPFLFTDACVNSIANSFLSNEKINVVVQKLRQIDFSVFYREGIYGKQGEFAKEYIQEEVYPDIILMPAYGNKGVMWQEISGRRRNSKGRFLLPVFMESDLEPEMIKLFGRFRWELCRTIQGAAWNNIQIKSLTSEYSDFIQFYRKNRELSDEKKEKLKMQIQKNRNNTREVFVQDYENWMKHESKGGLLLNKPVREILATYCPFNKEIRAKIGEQPMFKNAMAKYYREKAKKVKEYDLKFKVWEKDGIEIPPEVVETKRFYTEY